MKKIVIASLVSMMLSGVVIYLFGRPQDADTFAAQWLQQR